MQGTPLVYVLILNWNGWKDTVECVVSCLKLAYSNYHILIIDNGSSDNSEEILKKQFPNVEITQTGSNLGYAGGNNVGIKYALQRDAQYIWLLNNDTVVDPSALTELVKVAETDKSIGMVGSKIYYYEKPNVIWSAGSYFNQEDLEPMLIGSDQEDHGQFDKNRAVDLLVGCSIMVSRDLIKSVGLMDEKYYLLHEESDWCFRSRKIGFKLMLAPGSKVWHKCSQSLEPGSVQRQYYSLRNSLLFLAKHKPLLLIKKIILQLRNIYWSYSGKRYSIFESRVVGLIDFLRMRYGKLDEERLHSGWEVRFLRKIFKTNGVKKDKFKTDNLS